MAGVIFCVGLGGVLLILTICLLFGRGSMFIAGYNTASKEEKKRYDKVKLCRSAAFVTAVASLYLFSIAFFGYRVETGQMAENQILLPAGIGAAVLLLSVAASMAMNKRCIKKD